MAALVGRLKPVSGSRDTARVAAIVVKSWGSLADRIGHRTIYIVSTMAHFTNIVYIFADDLGYGELGYTGQNDRANALRAIALGVVEEVLDQRGLRCAVGTQAFAAEAVAAGFGRPCAPGTKVNIFGGSHSDG